MEFRRGAGSSLEPLYGKVTLTPTLLHSVGTSVVIPASTTFDLINGVAVATNVAPSPAPVDGAVEWAYIFDVTDNEGKSWEYMVGVPDGTTEINFNTLPRYFETRPPLFGEGPRGVPGSAATLAIGTVVSGSTPAVVNVGTAQEAVLDFTLAKGDKGDIGAGVAVGAAVAFSTLPDVFDVGVTVNTGAIANGWPNDFLTVVTSKQAAGRSVQQIFNDTNTVRMERTEQNGSWTVLRSLAYDALATPLLNGLMPALDKAKLENMSIAYRSKTSSSAPDSYPEGFSAGTMNTADGWAGPTGSNVQVVTFRSPLNDRASGQWVYSQDGSAPIYRSSSGGVPAMWGAFSTLATEEFVNNKQSYATPEQYGAVGNGTTDDSSAIETAINENVTTGKKVLFDSAKTYRITRPIISSVPALGQNFSIVLDSTDARPATIRMDSNGHRHFEFAGTEMPPTTLTSTVRLQRRAWPVASTANFRVGMLFSVVSSASWFYDPRPESTDARISEIHRVSAIIGNTVYSEAPSADGYNISDTTVTVTPIQPIVARVGGLKLTRPIPPTVGPTEDLDYVGIRLDFTSASTIQGLIVEHAAATALQIRRSYESRLEDNSIFGTNSYGSGYAITIQGCNYTTVKGSYITTSRRAVDVTAWVRIISRNTLVDGNTYVGGGKNVRGEWLGWDPVTGAYGDRNGGFGGHGVSDLTTMTNNFTSDCWEPFVVRGSNNIYANNVHRGNARIAVFGLDSGGGTIVLNGNKVLSGWLGTPKYQSGANSERARDFTRIGEGLSDDSRVSVTDNYAEVGNSFVLLGNRLDSTTKMVRFLVVTGNTVGLSDGTTDKGALLYNPSDVVEPIGSGRYWIIGPNTIRNDSLAAQAVVTRNVNISGAKVIDYTTSGATT